MIAVLFQFFIQIGNLFQRKQGRIDLVVFGVDSDDKRVFHPRVHPVHIALRAVEFRQDFGIVLPPDKTARRIGNLRSRVEAVVLLVFHRMVIQRPAADIIDDPPLLLGEFRIRPPNHMDLFGHQGKHRGRKYFIRMKLPVMGI